MSIRQVYLATKSERVGHWINALGFVLLIISGANIHFAKEFNIFGTFSVAVAVHEFVGVVVSINYIFWWIYMIGSGRIRFYLPNRDDMPSGLIKQAKFYLFGIFKGEPHPFEEGTERKFNPLQKWTYLGVMTVMLPLQIITGLALLFLVTNWGDARWAYIDQIGILHTVLAVFGTAFLFGHIYLATTGVTPLSHFKMMFTGWAETEEQPEQETDGGQ